jgi:hypothetical protein
MGKMKRRLSDVREASVRPMYVSVSFLFIACLLSLSTFFLVMLVHVSSLSVHGYILFFFLWIAFVLFFPCLFLSLFAPPSPFKNVLCSTVVLRVFIRLPLSPPSLSRLLSIIVILIILSRLRSTPTSSAALSLATSTFATAASPPVSTPHGHTHLHSLGHAYPMVYGYAHGHAYSQSHGEYTTLAPKAAAGGGGNGTGNVAIISGSAPGGTTSILRVDSSRSGGSVGPMEEVKDRDAGSGKGGVCRIRF